MRDIRSRLHDTSLYLPNDPSIMVEQNQCMLKLDEFNRTASNEGEKRRKLLEEMFAEFGEGSYIQPPLYANWAGHFCHFGKNVYANFNLTMVDDTHIYVGDCTMFGPNVTLATAGHPLVAELRAKGYQYNAPIHIGKNCWLGAGVIVMPGVTIGENTVIGAGSVVTKDILSGVLALGTPCRVVREIGEHEREYYFRDHKIDWDMVAEDLKLLKEQE